MNPYPLAEDILADAVRFLREEALPRLEGAVAFNLRVTVNALEIVERQLRCGSDAQARDDAWLEATVGPEGSREARIARLCEMLDRTPDALSDPRIASGLRRTVLDQLAIDQPSYSAYQAAVEAGEV